MKRAILLAIVGLVALQASAQLNIQKTDEVKVPVFSYGGYLDINKTNEAYQFCYYDAVSSAPKVFVMDNKQSAQDLINLSVKMYEAKNPKESYSFRKNGTLYQMEWDGDKLILYIIPDYGVPSSWNMKHYILETIKL